ncbi:MAG: hypothetical protein II937_09440 [Bacteroidales bacterium]|nr:hypothetical protein [Bacteroidales bacterium]
MKDKNVLIVGYGVVGKNLHKEIAVLEPDLYDIDSSKLPENYKRKHETYDFIFVCVDTPYVSKEKPCDISAIEGVFNRWKDNINPEGIFVIKSTVLSNKIGLLYRHTPHIVYSPEYYGNTPHCNNFEFNFTILGGLRKDCVKVQQLLQTCYDGRHIFRITEPYTACLAKYMENCWLATKVSFCSQFFELAEQNGVCYEDLRELFILDPRVNPSHTFIGREKPYWDSHCLNKDVRAIAETQNAEFLKNVIDFNEKMKK